MMFENGMGYPGVGIVVGLLASRARVGIMPESESHQLTQRMAEAVPNPIGPVFVTAEAAPCQEVVHKAGDDGFDLRTLLPAPTNTDEDAGPYFCEALALGSDPETGATPT
ncbi:UbiD family decarboxylase domain-containing protein [Streptomyces sp. NPDC050423]|uniref:UbiD family decarboxylase domain-containing protein n=1 Tax=Streptomyces sp. NPDC050423 TaxID=3155402 RepID=UPI003448F5C6